MLTPWLLPEALYTVRWPELVPIIISAVLSHTGLDTATATATATATDTVCGSGSGSRYAILQRLVADLHFMASFSIGNRARLCAVGTFESMLAGNCH
jgi:hypothetical protein